MQLDTKLAVVLRDDLAVWQKTNVTAFLVSGVAATVDGVVGEPYRDASGNEYLPMLVQPVLVYEADSAGLRRAYERAMSRDIAPEPQPASSTRAFGAIGRWRRWPWMLASRACNSSRSHSSSL